MPSTAYPAGNRDIAMTDTDANARVSTKSTKNHMQQFRHDSAADPGRAGPEDSMSSRTAPHSSRVDTETRRWRQPRASSMTPSATETSEEAAAASLLSMRNNRPLQQAQGRHPSRLGPSLLQAKVREPTEQLDRELGSQDVGEQVRLRPTRGATQPLGPTPPTTSKYPQLAPRQPLSNTQRQQQEQALTTTSPTKNVRPKPRPLADFNAQELKIRAGRPASSPQAIAAANHLREGWKMIGDFGMEHYGLTKEEMAQIYKEATEAWREKVAKEKAKEGKKKAKQGILGSGMEVETEKEDED